MRKLILGMLVGLVCYSQQITVNTLQLQAPPPGNVVNQLAFTTGVTGQTNYCYWVVSVYNTGMTAPSGPTCITNSNGTLTGGNFNTVTWQSPASTVTGFWVVRSTNSVFPGTGTVAVNSTVLASTVRSKTDQSNSLNSFTFTPAGNAVANERLDNQLFTQPVIAIDTPQNTTLFANLPSAANAKNLQYLVTDAASNATCASGGGTNTPAICWSNGSSWFAIGGSGGGGTGTVTVVGSGNLTNTALVTGGGTQTVQTPSATATMDASGNISTPGTIATGNGGGTTGSEQFFGATSGSAKITVAAVAGTPNDIALPTTTGTAGQILSTNGANPQQTSWVTNTISCQPGLGDGLNAIAAGTYLQSECFNIGTTFTITGVTCYTDNNGTSTLNITNGAGTALLTGAITCTNTIPGASGTQSGTTTIAANDGIKFTFVADATSKQTTWTITGHR